MSARPVDPRWSLVVAVVLGVAAGTALLVTGLPLVASLTSGVTVAVLAMTVATLTGLADPPADAEPPTRGASKWGLAGLAIVAATQAFALAHAVRESDRDGLLDHSAAAVSLVAVLLLLVITYRRQARRSAAP